MKLLFVTAFALVLLSFQNCGNKTEFSKGKRGRIVGIENGASLELPEGIEDEATIAAECEQGNGKARILLCHVPPGNPLAQHNICISEAALEEHLNHEHNGEDAHSDYLGPCVP